MSNIIDNKTDTIQFTDLEYKIFKNTYNKALIENKEIFNFKGCEFLTNYAKYLIEFIDK